ncbi:hypothetical protein E3P86_01071 [Wallemia ichthyophaga]|uniref:Uncharacterized protein n=1 Tax=Wallemia ichthyophaga TaxID=245174 RepID=A0A4T0J9P9_WALIC|nr:hypothetical protein E3P86_01071 [Wallemia ichthyophaga]
MNEIRISHFDEQFEDLEMILEFENLEKLTVYEDNIYANDVSLADVVELHNRLNENEQLNINMSFTDTRFFTNFNRLANKTSVNEESKESKEIKQRSILEYRAESDDDDPFLYEAVDVDENDDAQVVEGAVQDTSDELGEDNDDGVVVEEVTTVEGVPAEDLGHVLDDDNGDQNNVKVEESTETVTFGESVDDNEELDQHDQVGEDVGGDDERNDEVDEADEAVETLETVEADDGSTIQRVESTTHHIYDEKPVEMGEETVDQVEVAQPVHNEQSEPFAASKLDNDPSIGDQNGNNDSQIDAGVVEETEVETTTAIIDNTGENLEKVVKSVDVPTEDTHSLATSKRSFEEVEANDNSIDLGKTCLIAISKSTNRLTGNAIESKRMKSEEVA